MLVSGKTSEVVCIERYQSMYDSSHQELNLAGKKTSSSNACISLTDVGVDVGVLVGVDVGVYSDQIEANEQMS